MSRSIPVACALTDGRLQERRKNYLDKAAESVNDSAELSDGFFCCLTGAGFIRRNEKNF